MSTLINNDLKTIHDFYNGRHQFLFVEGTGAEFRLVNRQLNFVGRIWLWVTIKLGCSNASMSKVSHYIASKATLLIPKLQPNVYQCLLGKMEKYDCRHHKKIRREIDKIQQYAPKPPMTKLPHAAKLVGPASPMTQPLNTLLSQSISKINPAIEAWEKYQLTRNQSNLEEALHLISDEEACKKIIPHLPCDVIEKYAGKFCFKLSVVHGKFKNYPIAAKVMTTDQLKALFKHVFEDTSQDVTKNLAPRSMNIAKFIIAEHPEKKLQLLNWMCMEIEKHGNRMGSLVNHFHNWFDQGIDQHAICEMAAVYIDLICKKPDVNHARAKLKFEIMESPTVALLDQMPQFALQMEAFNQINVPEDVRIESSPALRQLFKQIRHI